MTPLPPEIYRLIVHETPIPIVVTDDSFAIVDVNRACAEFTGYTREEMMGTPPTFLVNDPETYDELIGRLVDGDPWEGELEAVTKSGERVFGHGATFPLVTGGELVGYVGIFLDLSERRRSEQTVNVLNRVLRHNIRNDANVVGGVLSTVRDDLSGVERELVDAAIGRVDRLLDRAETARDLHELLERSSAALVPRDLCDAVETTARDVVGEATTLHLDVPDDPVWVLADDALARGVAAVVENAVEHRAPGDRTPPADAADPGSGGDPTRSRDPVDNDVVASVESDESNEPDEEASPTVWVRVETGPEEAVLTVEDDGPGIDPERVEFLFGRREDSQLRHGQGLSLFFVDRLLDFYGGSVGYRPRDPTGCVFELRFRRVDAPA